MSEINVFPTAERLNLWFFSGLATYLVCGRFWVAFCIAHTVMGIMHVFVTAVERIIEAEQRETERNQVQ